MEQVSESVVKKALSLVREKHGVEKLEVRRVRTDTIPSSGRAIHMIWTHEAGNRNKPAPPICLDEDGNEVDLKELAASEGEGVFKNNPPAPDPAPPAPNPAASVTIDPTSNDWVLHPGGHIEEQITVTIPGDAGAWKTDIYFLVDSTGSMGPELVRVRQIAAAVISALAPMGIDVAYGVGHYKAFPYGPGFENLLSPAPDGSSAQTLLDNLQDESGGPSEAQLCALDQLADPPAGGVSWRENAKRIILWFGDEPGQDPIPPGNSGFAYTITEASVTAKLTDNDVTVLAASGANGALDSAPHSEATYGIPGYVSGGSAGQASRITEATGGEYFADMDNADMVTPLLDLASSAAPAIGNVDLQATTDIDPFVTVSPLGGYNDLSGSSDHVLPFTVHFHGMTPATDEDQVFDGYLHAVADGVIVATKSVRITVPGVNPETQWSYSVKFLLGQNSGTLGIFEGGYSTQVSIHNFHDKPAPIRKYIIPLVRSGVVQGREPVTVPRELKAELDLPAHSATLDDGVSFAEFLGGDLASWTGVSVGVFEIVSPVELHVTAVYAGTGGMHVEPIPGKRRRISEE